MAHQKRKWRDWSRSLASALFGAKVKGWWQNALLCRGICECDNYNQLEKPSGDT